MKLLVVDNHPLVVSGIRLVFSDDVDVAISVARNASEAEMLYGELRPDVTVIDINLSDCSGLELTRRLVNCDRGARILVFSMCDDAMFAARALEYGARGYLTKNEDPMELRTAVLKIAGGGVALSPALANDVALLRSGVVRSAESNLHNRDREILKALASGLTLTEVSHHLDISYKSAASACSRMRRELGVRNQLDLMQKVLREGYI